MHFSRMHKTVWWPESDEKEVPQTKRVPKPKESDSLN